MKNALVIQAVDDQRPETRQRADRVLRSIIEPACQATGYQAVRASDSHADTIAEPIISALNTHPLVIADLAAPPWNPNTLVEVGFRLATGRPILFLADTDPKPEIVPLQLRNVQIHIINSANPSDENARALIQSIQKYGPEVNAWESDYPTIEFSISTRSPDGGRFIFANNKAALLYGFERADELIGKPLNETDPRLEDFVPGPEYYREFERDQLAILGMIMRRDPAPKTASIPLWFTQHTVVDENHKIYWPVLTQYRYASPEEGADIVMRVIFINVSEWDPRNPRPPVPPQVLHVPTLFREVLPPPPPPPPLRYEYDVFLSYNSSEGAYVSELSQKLSQCGLKVWFDRSVFSGAAGITSELLQGMNSSRILAAVLGRNGLGRWQGTVELKTLLLRIIQGQKPFVLLLLPDVEEGDSAWRGYLNDRDLELVFENRLRLPLPPIAALHDFMSLNRNPTFAERLIWSIIQLLRGLDSREP
jgi:hypothetical protein